MKPEVLEAIVEEVVETEAEKEAKLQKEKQRKHEEENQSLPIPKRLEQAKVELIQNAAQTSDVYTRGLCLCCEEIKEFKEQHTQIAPLFDVLELEYFKLYLKSESSIISNLRLIELQTFFVNMENVKVENLQEKVDYSFYVRDNVKAAKSNVFVFLPVYGQFYIKQQM
ncbi:hypothetical protein FACS189465_2740 [Clostridia bacterium]|nr:hypothetical protein FACS189465_2740 [Clostridia bacterium]